MKLAQYNEYWVSTLELMVWFFNMYIAKGPSGYFSIKTPYQQNKDKKVSWPSHLYNGNIYTSRPERSVLQQPRFVFVFVFDVMWVLNVALYLVTTLIYCQLS